MVQSIVIAWAFFIILFLHLINKNICILIDNINKFLIKDTKGARDQLAEIQHQLKYKN